MRYRRNSNGYPSVNFVLHSIFVRVFVSLTKLYCRYRFLIVFTCIFVSLSLSFCYFRFVSVIVFIIFLCVVPIQKLIAESIV